MAREQTFLERIASLQQEQRPRYQPTAREDLEALMNSVGRHLDRVLNSRHGMSSALPDHGLPALSDLTTGTGDYVLAVQEAIRVAVNKYEPRLRRTRVVRVEGDDSERRVLRFRIEGTLASESGEHRIWYETVLKSDGQFEVTD